MSILELLRADGSIVVNKYLAKTIGLEQAILLSELISLHLYWKSRNELDQENMFYCTIDNLEENTTIKKDKQNKFIKELEKHGLIKTKLKGLPAKRYFFFCVEAIEGLFVNKVSQNTKADHSNGSDGQEGGEDGLKPHSNQFSQNTKTRSRNSRKQEVVNHETNNTDLNNTDLKNDDDDIKELASLSFFQRELIEQAQERHIPKQEIQETLKQVGDTVFQLEALDNTFDKVMPKYASGELSKFSSYFVSVLKREQRRINYAHSLPKNMPESKEPMPFYNWLES